MAAAKIRCAIYTRKSTEEGLDQGFNSLDAQHEACAAYIASQRHEGWVLAPDRFDDGGISGATLERPALQRLLGQIDAGRIRMVVVYKIDRLTRSLADFAKLVERLDAAGCSFVSVTQAFNTASSMGRLTLNVLLSFAQFEREVTAERIRDKIAASKKQGLWMGGLPPLGYDPHPDPKVRELVINDAEARTVQTLFQLYLENGSLVATERAAIELGLRSKARQFASGRTAGGNPLSRGQIHHILCNPVYHGQIRHHDTLWPGRHPAIIDETLWDEVQAALQSTARRRRARGSNGDAMQAPLTGKLRDETNDRLTPTHATNRGRRHRYYVSNRLISGGPDVTGWRLPAKQLEALVGTLVADHLSQAAREARLLAHPDLRANDGLAEAVRPLVEALQRGDSTLLADLIGGGTISPKTISITLDQEALAARLSVAADELAQGALQTKQSFSLRRRGVEAKLIVGGTKRIADPVLLRTLRDAHRWVEALRSGTPMSALAQKAGHQEAHIRTRAQLAFLSPKIQVAIKAGTLSPEVTLERLLKKKLPLDWPAQEQRLGV